MRRSSIPTLFKSCLRTVSKNISHYNHDDYLQVLPNSIKCTIVDQVTKHNDGFTRCDILQMLLNPQLCTLDLTDSIINDTCLEQMQKCTKLTTLQLPELNLNDCTKETLCDLIPHLTHLEIFSVRNADIMDEYVVSLLLKYCPKLTRLELENCINVTDKSMQYIAQMKLNALNLSRTSITDDGMQMLENSPLQAYLEDVNVKHCPVTCAGLKYLQWTKIKYIAFEIPDMESKITPEPKKGTGMCWFQRDIILT